MLLSWHVLSPSLILLWICSTRALCPETCSCRQNDKGQRKVSCNKGSMTTIPVSEMNPDMEVLEISAPENNHNTLSIGPILQAFKQLQEVSIRRSNVLQITMHAFWGVPAIKILDLSQNNISALFDHNFRGLVNLLELNLDDNKIERVQIGAFKHLTELRMLTMQRNSLSVLVPRIFSKLGKLHVLKLNENKLSDIDPDVFRDIPVSLQWNNNS